MEVVNRYVYPTVPKESASADWDIFWKGMHTTAPQVSELIERQLSYYFLTLIILMLK